MALPGTPGGGQQIAMSQINTEFGRSSTAQISLDTAENGGYGTINVCSLYYPSSTNPASMDEFHGYNHSAVCLSAFTMYFYHNFHAGYFGGENASEACSATYFFTVYASTSTIQNGTRLYYNSNGTNEIIGTESTIYYWYKINEEAFSYAQVTGITNLQSCVTNYDHYLADRYLCSNCAVNSAGILVAFPTGQNVVLNNFYPDPNNVTYSYKILSVTSVTGGYILTNGFGSFSTCALACSI